MMDLDRISRWPHNPRLLTTAAALLLVVSAITYGLRHPEALSDSVTIYESICRQIINNTTEGRQALIGSVWWPPLPVLLRLPILYMLPAELPALPSLLISAGAGCLILLLMAGCARKAHLGLPGLLPAVSVLVYPGFWQGCTDGSSATLSSLLMLVCAMTTFRWLRTNSLRSMMAFGGSAALLVATSPEAGLWLMATLPIIALMRRVSGKHGSEHRAAMLLALLPLIYGFCLWSLMNWLIMGDWLYFLRGVFCPGSYRTLHSVPDLITKTDLAIAMLVLPCLLFFRRGRIAEAYLSIASGMPLLVAFGLEQGGLLWSRIPLLSTLPILAAFTLSMTAARFKANGQRALPVLAITLLLPIIAYHYHGQSSGTTLPSAPSGAAIREAIADNVKTRGEHALVFVCGYASYNLLTADQPDILFKHTLDFNFHQIRRDYHGHELYLLIQAPAGRTAMDSIHWQYERIYELGSRNTLYVGDWNQWRLFELIQAPVKQ